MKNSVCMYHDLFWSVHLWLKKNIFYQQLGKEERKVNTLKICMAIPMNAANTMVAAVIGSIGNDGESEFSFVGATGTNYGTTAEFKVMNYHQAMKTVNQKEW